MRLITRLSALCTLVVLLMGSAAAAASKYRWRKPVITIGVSTSISSSAPNITANSDVVGAVEKSLATWQRIARIEFRQSSSVEQSVSTSLAQGDGVSLLTIAATPENLQLFPNGLDDATALTKVFYDTRGFITEADIVLNPYLQFSTDGTPGTFDLQSTITHEVGHLLGLNHSEVIGATMNDNYGRNGLYGLPAFSARTLSSDDIASVRALYGPVERDSDCCGRIFGKLSLANGSPAAGYSVWAEDVVDGHVVAAVTTFSDGSFRMSGLTAGSVRLFTQSGDGDIVSSAYELGEFAISTKQPIAVNRKLDRASTALRLDFLGFNGQLAETAVEVNSGNTYFLLIGGSNLGADDAIVDSSSRFITVKPRSYFGSFGSGIRTLGFDVSVTSDTPPGEYSLLVRSPSGERRFLIGGLTVDAFPNLWSLGTVK
jgi:hypothetical protein